MDICILPMVQRGTPMKLTRQQRRAQLRKRNKALLRQCEKSAFRRFDNMPINSNVPMSQAIAMSMENKHYDINELTREFREIGRDLVKNTIPYSSEIIRYIIIHNLGPNDLQMIMKIGTRILTKSLPNDVFIFLESEDGKTEQDQITEFILKCLDMQSNREQQRFLSKHIFVE